MSCGSGEGDRSGSPSVSKYQAAKLRTLRRANSIRSWALFQPEGSAQRAEGLKLAAKLIGCAMSLVVSVGADGPKVRGDFCRCFRQCEVCALRRSQEFQRKFGARLWWSLYLDPELSPYVFTLTVKDRAKLGPVYAHLRKAMQRLDKRRANREAGRSVGDSAWSRIAGAMWSVEFKRGENSRLWHPHIHGLALSAVPLEVEALRAEWKELTGDSDQVVCYPMWVRVGPGKYERVVWDRQVHGLRPEWLSGALVEVAKYATKDGGVHADLSAGDLIEIERVVGRARLIESAGVVRKAWPFWPSCAKPSREVLAAYEALDFVWSDDSGAFESDGVVRVVERDERDFESVAEGDVRMRAERAFRQRRFLDGRIARSDS